MALVQLQPHDFVIHHMIWNPQTSAIEQQLSVLKSAVASTKPECVVIVGIPRNHSKKITNQPWSKDYYRSKEKSREGGSKKAKVTLIYSKFPFTSEEWLIPVPVDSTDSTEAVPPAADISTHVTEICIPIGGWRQNRSPIEMLQDHELSYDEVATFSVIVTTCTNQTEISRLQQAFCANQIKNTVVLVSALGVFVDIYKDCWQAVPSSDPQTTILDIALL